MNHIAVLTSGGDAPGTNPAIRSVVRVGFEKGGRILVPLILTMIGLTALYVLVTDIAKIYFYSRVEGERLSTDALKKLAHSMTSHLMEIVKRVGASQSKKDYETIFLHHWKTHHVPGAVQCSIVKSINIFQ